MVLRCGRNFFSSIMHSNILHYHIATLVAAIGMNVQGTSKSVDGNSYIKLVGFLLATNLLQHCIFSS